MKKTLCIFTLAMLVAGSAWAQRFQSGELYYNITNETAKTVEVTYEEYYSPNNYSSLSSTVSIPATVTYNGTEYNVTSIGGNAFSYCDKLTQVAIPNSVTSIGYSAFDYCDALTAVYYTGNVAGWCGITFNYDTSNPLYYAHSLYINNQLVTELVIPEGITAINDYAFTGCNNITSITIPNSVTSIGYSAFYSCI